MRKRILPLILALTIIFGIMGTASAAARASDYFVGYGVGLSAAGNGRMKVTYVVDGTGPMAKIGVQAIYVEQKVNGVWKEYQNFYAVDHPEWYALDAYGHTGAFYFDAEVGVTYRATITVLAMNASGSEAKDHTSLTCECK